MSVNSANFISHNRNNEELEDQIDRLNGFIQNLRQNLDISRSYQVTNLSSNISMSCAPYMIDSSDSVSEDLEENYVKKLEEILLENDRLKMQIEDCRSGSDRNVTEVGCSLKEILNFLLALKELLFSRQDSAKLDFGTFSVKIRAVDSGNIEFPNKGALYEIMRDNQKESYNDRLEEMRDENEKIRRFYENLSDPSGILNEMHNQFIVNCSDPVIEEFRTVGVASSVVKQAALTVEINKYTNKNSVLDKAQKEIEWQLQEVKILRESFLSRISNFNEYKRLIDSKKAEEKPEASIIFPQKPKKKKVVAERRHTYAAKVVEKEEDLSLTNAQLFVDFDETSDTPIFPVPSYRVFTVESLQEQLKFLQDKAQSSSDPSRLFREIERVKTQITNLRGEQAINECKQKTKNMFKIVKHIEKSVQKEIYARGRLIQKYIRESNLDSSKDSDMQKEIQISLHKTFKGLDEKRLLQQRSPINAKKFVSDQDSIISELRSHINILFKTESLNKNFLESTKNNLKLRESEIQEKERFLMEHWKKNTGVKEIVEVVQRISKRLSVEKEKIDRMREATEEDKVRIEKKKLELEVKKERLRCLAERISEERNSVEAGKAEIQKCMKQLSVLPSYLNTLKAGN